MPPHPAPLFRNRATQVAQLLRERIGAEEWPDELPGERLLAHELGVGRRTIAAALRQLEQEGLVAPRGERRRSRLAPRPGAHVKRPARQQKVGLLLVAPLSGLTRSTILVVDELRVFFARRKVAFHLHDFASVPKRGLLAPFRRLHRQMGYDAWLLNGSSRELQAWCEKEGLPVILASAAFPGVALTGVELGFERTCHHAVGKMVRAGHRELVFILPKHPHNIAPGDRASRVGFQEGVAAFAHLGARGTVETFSKEPKALLALVDRLLARTPRPTAWLIRTPYFLTVMVRLLQLGVRIPQEISLVCRDNEAFFPHLPLAPSCYRSPPGAKARLLGSLTMRLLQGERLPPVCHPVIPEWVEGETLARRPTRRAP